MYCILFGKRICILYDILQSIDIDSVYLFLLAYIYYVKYLYENKNASYKDVALVILSP